LTKLGLPLDQYRVKWNLPHDYPMVASNYAAQRSALAKKRRPRKAAESTAF
jgi:predicted transcriptional regulator